MADKIIWDDEGVVWDDAPVVAAKGNGQASASPAIPENTLGQEALRQGGLFLRHALTALGSVGALPADAIGKAVNYTAGREVVPNQQRALQQSLTGLGLPEAERPIERFTQGMAESAPAVALPVSLPAQMLGNAAIGATQAQPGEELKGATIGAAAGSAPSALKGALQVAGKVAAPVLGMTTGAGAEAIKQAAKGTPEFAANMRGNVPASSVVEQAKQGLQNMRQSMYDAYATAKGGWANDTTVLPFEPISDAADAAAIKYSFRGVPQPGTEGVKQQIEAVLKDWKQRGAKDPRFFTVEGLDALKRHLQDIVPDNIANRTGRAYVTEVVNGVKRAINEVAPAYKDAMTRYWNETAQLDEITKSLSLGDKASIDTALRKLQSLTRNNVNTNYGARMASAEALATQGGEDVFPAVAGQAMSSWTPRGLQGAIAGGAGVPAALLSPKALMAAPLMSPRLVGEALHRGAQVTGDPRTQAIIDALRRSTPAITRSAQDE